MRQKIIAGNWKMNKTVEESKALAAEIVKKASGITGPEIVLCPTYVALSAVAKVIKGTSIKLGAQDVHWEDEGAFTSKISINMLKSVGCQYVIIGHSEPRTYFNETDENVNKKAKKVLSAGLIPIICVGETLQEREGGITEEVVKRQVTKAYEGISADQAQNTVIAYEPVWAIGTGKTASDDQAQEVHAIIRNLMTSLYSAAVAQEVQIQYGGSMKADNAAGLLGQTDIDGGLIGGAALKADSFLGIINAA